MRHLYGPITVSADVFLGDLQSEDCLFRASLDVRLDPGRLAPSPRLTRILLTVLKPIGVAHSPATAN